jgi:hypothetical protein
VEAVIGKINTYSTQVLVGLLFQYVPVNYRNLVEKRPSGQLPDIKRLSAVIYVYRAIITINKAD